MLCRQCIFLFEIASLIWLSEKAYLLTMKSKLLNEQNENSIELNDCATCYLQEKCQSFSGGILNWIAAAEYSKQ